MPDMVTIDLLDAHDLARETEPLAGILDACVHDGASVGFILPFTRDEARAFWREAVMPAVAGGKRLLFAAWLDGRLVGTVQLDLDVRANQAHRGEIAKLLVHPQARRHGLGRALMQAAEARALAAGRSLLTLDTAGQAAEALYLSLGFIRAGTIPGYARDPLVDRLDATTIFYKVIGRGADQPRSTGLSSTA